MNTERFLPYGRQTIDQADINSVVKVFDSDFLTQGPRIGDFEKAFSEYVGAKYALACSNGTAALHLCCQALGLSSGDKLVTSPVTFLSSANCAQFVNADTLFVDIDSDTVCLSPDKLEDLLKKEDVDVVVPVHLAGHSADMQSIFQLKEKYGFHIIEDACHAPGGKYGQQKVGSCHFSDMSIFSFHPVKHMTAGEGGMVTTNNEDLYKKLLRFRIHGMHKDPSLYQNKELAYDPDGELNMWYYEMFEVGHNYRITDIQCALGLSQLKKNDKGVDKRRLIASQYNEAFRDNMFIKTPIEKTNVKHAYHLYTILVDFDELGKSRNAVMKELRDQKIGTQVLYIPVHLQPYYANKYGTKWGDFPMAEDYYDHCLSIPMFPGLEANEVQHVIDCINKVIL
jgi:UDP-4-amino-4,6-dideoxy-N-acetyl-beta-L-altrosamine transaminase